MDPIRLSALARGIQVGDLYNYYTDSTLRTDVLPLQGMVLEVDREANQVTTQIFTSQCPEKFRHSLVGISAHLERNIIQGTLDLKKLWLAKYLQSNPTEFEDVGARVTVYFKVIGRTETLSQDVIDTKMYDYQVASCGRATHLVDQVVYGAEFILCMRRNVDVKVETKRGAEDKIYWAAKTYFERIIKNNWTLTEPPLELAKVSCTLFNSLNVAQTPMKSTFQQSVEVLREAVLLTLDQNWRPVEISLRHIPAQLETLLQTEKMTAKKLFMELDWYRIWTKSHMLLKHPVLQRVPPFERILRQFRDLLEPLRSKIELCHALRTLDPPTLELSSIIQGSLKDLLANAMDWLERLRKEIAALHLILDGSQLPMFDMSEIESRPLTARRIRAEVFILHVDYQKDSVMEGIQNVLGFPSSDVKRPFFPITSVEKKRLEGLGQALRVFSEDSRRCSNKDNSYQIGLVPVSSPMNDGSIKKILFPAKMPSPCRNIPRSPPPLVPIFDPPTGQEGDIKGSTGPLQRKRPRESSEGDAIPPNPVRPIRMIAKAGKWRKYVPSGNIQKIVELD